jgi:ribosomal protein L11 methyltransferase
VILANINRNILLNDIQHYNKNLREGGKVFFSGFYAHDLASIVAEAEKYGWRLLTFNEKNEWIAASFQKGSTLLQLTKDSSEI